MIPIEENNVWAIKEILSIIFFWLGIVTLIYSVIFWGLPLLLKRSFDKILV